MEKGGNGMKWFDIVKSTNPYSLYSQEEIEEMAEEVESHMKIYGGRQCKYYGNLEPLGRLRADYNLWSFSNRNTKYNYWIKEIRFELLTDEGYNDNPLSKIYVDVLAFLSSLGGINLTLLVVVNGRMFYNL